jgi:hypothetical protein
MTMAIPKNMDTHLDLIMTASLVGSEPVHCARE